jgi:penicillin-binding protein 2
MPINDNKQQRQFIILGVFIFSSLILLGRAAQLQLLSSNSRTRADAMTIEKNILYPSRGVVYDRNGKLMVYNNPMYDLMVTYRQVDPHMDTAKFCRLLGIDTAFFMANLNRDWKSGKFNRSVPFPFMTMITPEQYARIQESLTEFPGFEPQIRNVRGYPQHNAGSVLGYLSEVSEKQLRDSIGLYESGDYVGKTGLERYYETTLRGQKGIEYILKDNLGRRVGKWKDGKLDSSAIQGSDLQSTIDLKLQALAERLLKNKIGAVVAIEPKTGEIMAMVTSPNFDPEQMVISKKRGEFIAALSNDSLKPLFDRCVSAEYPPGSIFKPMIGAIALQMGVWDRNNWVTCNGGYHIGNRVIKCHGPSPRNMSEAIEHSCNAYFCTVFRTIVDQYGYRTPNKGLDSLNEYLYRFGMGRPLGIDFPIEKDGLVPTSKMYAKANKRDGGIWYSGYIASNGIGQGENQLTTMQMANLAAIIANRGWYFTPHLVRGYRQDNDPNNMRSIDKRFTTPHSTGVAATHFEYIVNGMREVIVGSGGTAPRAQVDGIDICGKTGTVQNQHGDDSSVFIGFAPANDPKIAIAVYIENGKWGNDIAAPITGLMVEQYINGKISKSREALVERLQRSRLAYSPGKGYYVTRE